MTEKKHWKTIPELKAWLEEKGERMLPETYTHDHWEVYVNPVGENPSVDLFAPADENGDRECWSGIMNPDFPEDLREFIEYHLYHWDFQPKIKHNEREGVHWLVITETTANRILRRLNGLVTSTQERLTL